MIKLSLDDQLEIVHGCAILGAGGGGPLSVGVAMVRNSHEAGAQLQLADFDELQPETLVACVYGAGSVSMAANIDHETLMAAGEYPAITALRTLSEHLGRPIEAVISSELGGANTATAMFAAALMDLPLVDADPVGRSVPEMQQSTFYLSGLDMSPMGVVDAAGNCAVFVRVVDDESGEILVRALAEAAGNVWAADHPASARDMKGAVIRGALSDARRIGRAYLSARRLQQDVGSAVAASAGGSVRFRGTVTVASWEDRGGFTWGEASIAGADEWAGEQYDLWLKNEFISGKSGDIFDVTAPDVISLFDTETHEPVMNPGLQAGMHVSVVALPAPEVWRSESGLAVLGPRHFGLDTDYRPFS